MKMKELQQKSREELMSVLMEKRARIEELRFLIHQKKAKDVKESLRTRKDIARIMTLLQGMG